MDRTITIQRFSSTVDDFGTPVETWSDLMTLRAQQVQTSTDEYIRGYGASDETIIIFRTWWHADVTTADRVVYAGENYNIKETRELGRRAGLELRCQRIA
ncbi:MAG TPA: phage head closure protein [Nitrobacter sp.]|nr:phage head closure protein [Nitrobacter sp.]